MYPTIRVGALSVAGLLSLVGGCLEAETIYTYSANYGSYAVPIAFVTSLSGSQLDNLPANTNISASVLAFSMLGVPAPPQDAAGFALGLSGFRAPDTVLIGTDAAGNITSFDVTGTLFASYPAIPNENPNDFFWALLRNPTICRKASFSERRRLVSLGG